MSDITGAFDTGLVFGANTAGAATIGAAFTAEFTFGTRFFGSQNSLRLTPDTASSLAFSADTPGTLTLTPDSPGGL